MSKFRFKSLPTALVAVAIAAIVALEIFRSGAGIEFGEFESGAVYDASSAIALNPDRPASLFLPEGYSPENPVPLLINLHGYSGEGSIHSSYTFLQLAAKERGLAYIAPDGSEDSFRNRFWSASEACCNFNAAAIDDVAYLKSLVDEALATVSIDATRIYLFGHSNGHFMSYKFACSTDGLVAAVAGIAGAMDTSAENCQGSPTNVLHIHGTNDQTILYTGGELFEKRYPSVNETIAQWGEINSCTRGDEGVIDLLSSMSGAETTAERYRCEQGNLELWRINEGLHTPALDKNFAMKVIDWLLLRSL